jgi:hypothetical protein
MIDTIEITGAEQVDKILSNLPDAIQYKVVISALRKAARPMVEAQRRLAPKGDRTYKNYRGQLHTPGWLKKSHGIVNGKNRRYPSVYVGPRYGKKYKYDGYYFKFLIEGTDRRVARHIKRPLDNWIEQGARQTEQQVQASIERELIASLDRKMQSIIRRYGSKSVRIAA